MARPPSAAGSACLVPGGITGSMVIGAIASAILLGRNGHDPSRRIAALACLMAIGLLALVVEQRPTAR